MSLWRMRVAEDVNRMYLEIARRRAEVRGAEQDEEQEQSGEDEVSEDGQPAIVAELPTEIATLSVGEAVMRMDLADNNVLMFRNRTHGGLNVVYRRRDGNIGWIDPAGAAGNG